MPKKTGQYVQLHADFDGVASTGRRQVVAAAFAAADLDRPVRMVEISVGRRIPAVVAISFQLLDTVVHTWDLATAPGAEFVRTRS